jgi:aspartyl-tRNA(Asn)/glutamyl-tRNA(Gln) amidotransferase subunit A
MVLESLTIEKAHELLKKREISVEELVRAHLERIREQEPGIHSFLEVYENDVFKEARRIDAMLPDLGLEFHILTGIPGAIKDNILIKGKRATAASKILENYVASYDATVVERLRKVHAVFLGKTNLDEFAMGSSTENSAFGPTKNPRDLTRVPGGSSGGSAAAVAGGMALWALGSDTGGSIRQPAGFCGVVGLKPTYGAVSRYGLIAMASSLDQIGPFAKSVRDVAIVFEAIAGYDPMDATSLPQVDYKGLTEEIRNSKLEIRDLRVGLPKEYFAKGIDPIVEKSVKGAIKKLEELGANVTEISLPHTPYALPCYYIIQPAEVSANLARYDGIKYGMSKSGNLQDLYFETRGEGFGKEVRRRILLGTYVLSAGYYDAYYAKAQRVRRLIREDFINAFKKVDIIITPTSPTLPFNLGERIDDPVSMYLADVYTVSVNLAGLPGLSMPCAWIEKDGKNLPVGLQIIGKHFDEKTILAVADKLEQELQEDTKYRY